MNNQYLKYIGSEYLRIKREFQTKENKLVVLQIANQMPEYPIFVDVFSFLTSSFKGYLRRDGKTPLVSHSILVTKILYLCKERSLDTLLTGALHDVLEDTDITEQQLLQQPFFEDREYIIKYLRLMKEDKTLSRKPDGKTLPPRYREHITRLLRSKAPREVVNVEIIDRFCDLMDLEYITNLPEPQKTLRLNAKSVKVRSFVENLTRDRDDINQNCLELFKYKLKKIENLWNVTAQAEIIF